MEREKMIDKIENNLFIITEGEVVLTREEYERLKNIEVSCVHSFEWEQGYEDGTKRARKETATQIWEKGRQLYNKHSDKDIAMNLLAAWIENNFGLEVE